MRVVPPDIASQESTGRFSSRGLQSAGKTTNPHGRDGGHEGSYLELSGSAGITRRAVFGDLRDGCVIDEVGTGTTGETSYRERTPTRPSTEFNCM